MEIRKVPISKVEVWKKNLEVRVTRTEDYNRTKSQIQRLKIFKPVTAFQENGRYYILGGRLRYFVVRDLKHEFIDISVVHPRTDAEKWEYVLADNDQPSTWLEDKLAENLYPYLGEINLEDYRIDIGKPINLKELVESYGPESDKDDEVPEIDDSPAITKMEDLFTLGKHRLLCGDATKKEDVKRLMNGQKADMVFTDPPYNVQKEEEKWDSKTWEEYKKFTKRWFKIAKNLSEIILFTSGTGRHLINLEFWFQIERPYWMLIWQKNNTLIHNPIGGFQAWEPLLLYGKPKKKIPQDVYICPIIVQKDVEKDGYKIHPTPKQMNLWIPILGDFTNKNDLILDLFLGSGTTLIACEKLNRICFGMDTEPKYLDVTITRYCNFTGISEEEIRATRENQNG